MTIAIGYTTVESRLALVIAGILSNAVQSLHLPKHIKTDDIQGTYLMLH